MHIAEKEQKGQSIYRFEKEAFKKEILNNIKYLFRKTAKQPAQQEIFQAVTYASKDMIIDDWMKLKGIRERGSEDRLLSVHGVPDGPCPGQQPDQSLLL